MNFLVTLTVWTQMMVRNSFLEVVFVSVHCCAYIEILSSWCRWLTDHSALKMIHAWVPWVWGTTKSALYKYTYLYLYINRHYLSVTEKCCGETGGLIDLPLHTVVGLSKCHTDLDGGHKPCEQVNCRPKECRYNWWSSKCLYFKCCFASALYLCFCSV